MPFARPLSARYHRWLCRQITPSGPRDGMVSYRMVCEVMDNVQFRVLVVKDDNRAEDGYMLRNDFLLSIGYEPLDIHEMHMWPVTILEVLVALALKAEKLIEIPPPEMFGIFLRNLKLTIYYDGTEAIAPRLGIHKILRRFNDRNYTRTGQGGLFPLRRGCPDQREVEIWYQMGAYMSENRMY